MARGYARLNQNKFQTIRRIRGLTHNTLAGINQKDSYTRHNLSPENKRKRMRYEQWVWGGAGVPPDELERMCDLLDADPKDIIIDKDVTHLDELIKMRDIFIADFLYGDGSKTKAKDVARIVDAVLPWVSLKPKDKLLLEQLKAEAEEGKADNEKVMEFIKAMHAISDGDTDDENRD